MNKIIREKILESLQSVMPVTVIIIILSFSVGIPSKDILEFGIGGLMLIVGLILFTLGASASMMKLSEEIGRYITKKQNLLFLITIAFTIGFLITVAEPSIWVLADQFTAIPSTIFIGVISLGVAIFLVIALLRIIFQVKLRTILLVGYAGVFLTGVVIAFVQPEFIPVAFDSGGATTGPMAVPFIIALGLGVARTKGDENSDEDSFGLVGIASIGPILAVLVLGMIWNSSYGSSEETVTLGGYFIRFLGQVGIAILPFILFFAIFQIFAFRLSKKRVIRILIGFLFTYIGLVLYLTGANAGFISIGTRLGKVFGAYNFNWVVIPLLMVIGFLIVAAEPSVIVLNKQVEDITGGTISRKVMMLMMSLGVAFACGLSMVRVLTGISIWYILVPGYLLALLLTFFVPKVFTAIAFDSGGAVSGAMTSTFLMPFALGASEVIATSNPLLDAFGLIAFIALSPLITLQILGLIFALKEKRQVVPSEEFVEDIIDLREVQNETTDNHH